MPLLMNLLSSKESESKAGGLNILGSLCGLSYDFTNPSYKIQDNLEFFFRNSKHISLAIWQFVFDLQEDWDITIKEASSVLIQLCAPREAIKHFHKVKKEKETLKLKLLLQEFPASGPEAGSLAKLQAVYKYVSGRVQKEVEIGIREDSSSSFSGVRHSN